MKTQVYLKHRSWTGETKIVRPEEVPEFIRKMLMDGSGNCAVIIETNTNHQERWTYEWKEVIL